ncbi:hypothetical protein MIR68_000220 [Amoeboaphelidium protococcarum]|nr:hypothetical protein MIR68_000220 [Amoeboaphelidium protococcarum]
MTDPRSQTPDGVNAEMLDVLHQLQIENQNLRNTLHAAVRISEGQRSESPKLVLPEKYAGNRELYRGFVNQLSVLFELQSQVYLSYKHILHLVGSRSMEILTQSVISS